MAAFYASCRDFPWQHSAIKYTWLCIFLELWLPIQGSEPFIVSTSSWFSAASPDPVGKALGEIEQRTTACWEHTLMFCRGWCALAHVLALRLQPWMPGARPALPGAEVQLGLLPLLPLFSGPRSLPASHSFPVLIFKINSLMWNSFHKHLI